MKAKLMNIMRYLVSASLIGLLLWMMRKEMPDIISTLKNVDIFWLSLGFAVYFLVIIILAFRLLKVISIQSITLSIKESIYLTFIGFFFNNFLPTSFGGDFVKAYYAGKKSNRIGPAFAGIFMDRFLAMIPFTLIPVFAITFLKHKMQSDALRITVYASFAVCVVFLWLLLHRSTAKYLAFVFEPFKEKLWYNKIRDGYEYLNAYSRHKVILSWSFVLSLGAQTASIISTFFFARAIGIDSVHLGIFFIVVPLIGIITLIPSVNGLGVREGGYVYLLNNYLPAEKAFSLSIVVLATLIVSGIIGGIIYAFKKSDFSFKEEDV